MKPVSRASRFRRVAVAAVLAATAGVVAAAPAKGSLEAKLAAYPVKLAGPLHWGPDSVEVTAAGTLRRRYRVWGDWDAEVRAYLAEARTNAAARGTPPRRVRMGCVFLKDARITFPRIAGADGRPLTGVYSTPADFIEGMTARGMPGYRDFMYAFSRGELEVEWLTATLEGLEWVSDADRKPAWSCQPKAAGEAFLKALASHRDDGVGMWMLCAGRPSTLNGRPDQRIGAPPYGISYTQWPIYGGYSLVISEPDVGLMVHEFNHRYLDNLPAIEGIRLTQFHGLANLGYGDADVGYPHLMNTYRSVYEHLIRRDMWRRFTLAGSNATPREAFSGKAYAWAEVSADCWFRLPELHRAELARLTGLPSFGMDAPPAKTWRLYTVAAADRAVVRSPYTETRTEDDTRPDNLLSLRTESSAVVRTATGHWLFVRPDLADLYVDMNAIAGRPGGPLPVYGYVLEGVRPLVVLRAPPEFPVPSREIGYFRADDRGTP